MMRSVSCSQLIEWFRRKKSRMRKERRKRPRICGYGKCGWGHLRILGFVKGTLALSDQYLTPSSNQVCFRGFHKYRRRNLRPYQSKKSSFEQTRTRRSVCWCQCGTSWSRENQTRGQCCSKNGEKTPVSGLQTQATPDLKGSSPLRIRNPLANTGN